MSVADLTNRITKVEAEYQRFRHSSDSLILIQGEIHIAKHEPTVVDLTVGDKLYYPRYGEGDKQIPKEGLLLRPGEAAVVHTAEMIGVPLNLFGLLAGKGKLIFEGVFISVGKLNPGFVGKLRIGIFNGGAKDYLLKTGDTFCSCCFFQMDSHLAHTVSHEPFGPPSKMIRPSVSRRFLKALFAETPSNVIRAITAIIIALLAVIGFLLREPITTFVKHLLKIKP